MTAHADPQSHPLADARHADADEGYIVMRVGGEWIGIPVLLVRDVLRGGVPIAEVALAPPEIAGLMNLRGRIVTVLDMRVRLGLPPAPPGAPRIHAVVEHKGEPYSLMVDAVGEVLNLPAQRIEPAPANLDQGWRAVAAGVSRLGKELLIILDVQALLTLSDDNVAG